VPRGAARPCLIPESQRLQFAELALFGITHLGLGLLLRTAGGKETTSSTCVLPSMAESASDCLREVEVVVGVDPLAGRLQAMQVLAVVRLLPPAE
jgi:hypothetical protein